MQGAWMPSRCCPALREKHTRSGLLPACTLLLPGPAPRHPVGCKRATPPQGAPHHPGGLGHTPAGGSLLGGAEYVNSQIFSTRANATLPANLTARFDAAIEEAGLGDVLPDISGYCSIDYSASCQYAPWVPGLGSASPPAASPGSAPAPAPAGPTSSAVLGPRLGAVGMTLLAAATAALL